MGWKERLECPVDSDGGYVNDRWTNRDLIPIPPERRTYKVWSFAVYWFVSGACISAYTTGSSLLAYGLTAQQAMACVVIGAMITGILSVLSGMPGEIHHVGFVIMSRMSWGMYGHYIPLTLSCFTSIFWFGIQAVWGGQAVNLMLGAMSPAWKNSPSRFPDSAHITHQDFTGVLLWYCAFVPLVLLFPPEKLQKPFIFSSAAFGATLIGLLAWAVSNAGGGGPLFKTQNTAEDTSFSMMLGITSILSSWGAGTIGQSDWVRYSQRRYYPLLSQLIAAPVMITSCALVGVVVTSASSQILNLKQDQLIWNPIFLLAAIQTHYGDSSSVRAAVFFAGLGCTCAQLSINVILNAVSTGMMLAGYAPKYINIKRGAVLLGILGLAVNPWQISAAASTFLGVISGFGIFIAPMTGIMLCDYLVIRKRRLVIPDLYIGDSSSIYWYWHGYHWRTIVAFLCGFVPLFPGFLMNLMGGYAGNGWIKLFQITFLVGLSVGFTVFLVICLISPPPHYKEGENFLDDAKYSKSVARTKDLDYKSPNTLDRIPDPERVLARSEAEEDDSDKFKSRDVTVNENPVPQ